MVEGQSWKITGYVNSLYWNAETNVIKGRIDWVAPNGSSQYREFKAKGKLANDMFESDYTGLVTLHGYHDFEKKEDRFYTVMVVQKVDWE